MTRTVPDKAPPLFGARAAVRLAALLLGTLVVFALLGTQVDLQQSWATVRGARLSLLVPAALIMLFSTSVVVTVKWGLILRRLDCPIRPRELFVLVVATFPVAVAAPFRSGEVVKALYLRRRHGFPLVRGIGSLILDNVFDLAALVIFTLYGIAVVDLELTRAVAATAGALGVGVVAIGVLARRARHEITEPFRCIGPRLGLALLALSLAGFFLNFIVALLCYRSVGAGVPLSSLVGLIPACLFVGSVPVTVSGFGTRDAAMLYFFRAYGSEETILAGALLCSIVPYLVPSAVGLLFLPRVMGRILPKRGIRSGRES